MSKDIADLGEPEKKHFLNSYVDFGKVQGLLDVGPFDHVECCREIQADLYSSAALDPLLPLVFLVEINPSLGAAVPHILAMSKHLAECSTRGPVLHVSTLGKTSNESLDCRFRLQYNGAPQALAEGVLDPDRAPVKRAVRPAVCLWE